MGDTDSAMLLAECDALLAWDDAGRDEPTSAAHGDARCVIHRADGGWWSVVEADGRRRTRLLASDGEVVVSFDGAKISERAEDGP